MQKRHTSSTIARAFWSQPATVPITIAVLAFVVILARPPMLFATQPESPPNAQGYKLVFEDNFDTRDLGDQNMGPDKPSERHTWHPDVWFSAKHMPRRNISVAGSILSLTWTPDEAAADSSITTLSPDRQQFRAWRYGYFEARMRWDVVKGSWPAFWLIPVQDAKDQNTYNGTRRSGEIDVFEGQGDHPHTFYGTVHEWTNYHTDHASRDNSFQLPQDADMSQFHIYGLLWTPGKVTWFFDNRPLHSEETPAVFDKQDFILVLTMQEGVDWKSGNLSGVKAPALTLNVDWVRVWQK